MSEVMTQSCQTLTRDSTEAFVAFVERPQIVPRDVCFLGAIMGSNEDCAETWVEQSSHSRPSCPDTCSIMDRTTEFNAFVKLVM